MSAQAHACFWPGCGEQVGPKHIGCRVHWRQVPARLRDRVWNAFNPEQALGRVAPSPAYIAAVQQVHAWAEQQQQSAA